MAIKAILFDMDGVLVDAREWHYEALNRALGLFGLSISRYDHLVTYDGLPTKKKLEMLSVERELPRLLHPFINDLKQRYTIELVHRNCRPNFRRQYALARLKAEGFKIVVCSNSIKSTIEIMMDKSGLSAYLDFILSNEDVLKAKPDPEIYVTAIRRLGLAPSECLIVEDNENGIKAARGSGAYLMTVGSPDDVDYYSISKALIRTEGPL